MRLKDIADRLGCKLEGPEDLEITGVAGLEEAAQTDLTFLANPKYARQVETTQAGAVIVGTDFQAPRRSLLRSDNPYLAFAKAIEMFHPAERPPAGIHSTAVVAPSARVGRNASIGPYVVIEDDAVLGDDCVLKSFVVIYRGARIGDRFMAHAHAVVRENTRIGDDVILQNGAVVGADGFGFARQSDGSYYKIAPAGTVVVEDGVEIQAHSCIDRATVGETRLRRGVKVDNLVQVGHGCDVGDNTLLCSQTGLAGSTKLGRNVVMTGQTGAAGHLTIGDNVIVTPQSGVPHDVAPGRIVSGSPVIDHALWLKSTTLFARLPEIYQTLRKIRRYLEKSGAEL
ncbi:MAG: UDP-3-O-(3-hydroxymyristoyl)glucosamine N-acyltransferase [Terriglobia bacterium]